MVIVGAIASFQLTTTFLVFLGTGSSALLIASVLICRELAPLAFFIICSSVTYNSDTICSHRRVTDTLSSTSEVAIIAAPTISP